MASRRDREHRSSGNETETQDGPVTSDAETGAGLPGDPESSTAANGPAVDTATGQISGAGFEEQAAPTVDIVHMPKKITPKDIVGRMSLKMGKKWKPELDANGAQAFDKQGAPLGVWELDPPKKLYLIFGTTSGTRTGTSNFGDWISFTGTFEAVREIDGARFASNEAILQEPAQTLLMQQLGAVKARDPSGSVGFSFEIGVRTSQRWVDTNEGNSYEYTVTSIFNVSKHDPLAHMRAALLPHMPKPKPKELAAPDKPV